MKPVWIEVHAPHLSPKERPKDEPRTTVSIIHHEVARHDYGPKLWENLHLRALSHFTDDSTWLANFPRSLPCGSCRKDWADMMRRTPPQWERYFEWTVDRHNEINAKLSKTILSHGAARAHWLQNELVNPRG